MGKVCLKYYLNTKITFLHHTFNEKNNGFISAYNSIKKLIEEQKYIRDMDI